MNQNTIGRSFVIEGIGIHSGVNGRITVRPGEPNSGRVFLSQDVRIPAHVSCVVDTTRSTTIGRDGVRISTVEHLLSALAGLGVDNCVIEVEGPEIPILDGSARGFVEQILASEVTPQGAEARTVTLREPIQLTSGATEMRAEPSDGLRLAVTTEFAEWPAGQATITVVGAGGIPDGYQESIAPARTFAFRHEVDMLIAAGLARGGSLDNALIIDPPDRFSSELRVRDEWCAHKLLDVLGDLALLDARLVMSVSAVRPGHRANTALAQQIFAQCAAP